MTEKITKDTTLNKVIEKCPEAAELLKEKGLHCIGCPIAAMETLEQGAKAHGLSEEEIEEIVKKINKKLKTSS